MSPSFFEFRRWLWFFYDVYLFDLVTQNIALFSYKAHVVTAN